MVEIILAILGSVAVTFVVLWILYGLLVAYMFGQQMKGPRRK